MPQYIVLGYDGADSDALSRRMAVREKHLEVSASLVAEGKLLYAVATLNDEGKMCGSCMITEFENRTKLDEWLKAEPYVTGNVWQRIEVKECKTAPVFQKK